MLVIWMNREEDRHIGCRVCFYFTLFYSFIFPSLRVAACKRNLQSSLARLTGLCKKCGVWVLILGGALATTVKLILGKEDWREEGLEKRGLERTGRGACLVYTRLVAHGVAKLVGSISDGSGVLTEFVDHSTYFWSL